MNEQEHSNAVAITGNNAQPSATVSPPSSPPLQAIDASNTVYDSNNYILGTDGQTTNSTSNDTRMDDDEVDELAGLELLQAKGKGVCGLLERIPMGCKLCFMAVLLLLGMAFFGL